MNTKHLKILRDKDNTVFGKKEYDYKCYQNLNYCFFDKKLSSQTMYHGSKFYTSFPTQSSSRFLSQKRFAKSN